MATNAWLNCVDEEDRCRHCQASSLLVDWAAGDRVCTNCGVVNEQHLRDDRPEWREFNDADDLAKGLPSAARCGAKVDEGRYIGGLEPTTLSKAAFGGTRASSGPPSSADSAVMVRKKLVRASRRIDLMTTRRKDNAFKAAKISWQIRKRQLNNKNSNGNVDTETDFTEEEGENNDNHVLPEHEQLLIQEEEDAHRAHAVLSADKWSLERAILLHGTDEEQQSKNGDLHNPFDRQTEQDDLLQHLDGSMRRASIDLYRAYSILQSASRRLHLPDCVLNEATSMLCKYAARKNGFFVKGVSSRLSTNRNGNDNTTQGTKKLPAAEKETLERLREFNKWKQMASLGSALLFLIARNLGWARSLTEIRSSFKRNNESNTEPNNDAGSIQSAPEVDFIKTRHCSKAVAEVKAIFPEIMVHNITPSQQSVGNVGGGRVAAMTDAVSTGNFVEHATRKLDLPPVALASIRSLVMHCRKEQIEKGAESGTKLTTICASMTLFVCMAGATMQKLAQQAQSSRNVSISTACLPSLALIQPMKKRKITDSAVDKDEKTEIYTSKPPTSSDSFDGEVSSVVSETSSTLSTTDVTMKPERFDVFSHEAFDVNPAAKQEYEARRIWDAWSEQMPWYRNVGRVEQSCGVSRQVITDHFKKYVFPKRQALLVALKDFVLKDFGTTESHVLSVRDAPLASALLSNITSAAALMSNKVK